LQERLRTHGYSDTGSRLELEARLAVAEVRWKRFLGVQDEDLVTQAMSDDVPPLSAESILPGGKYCGETYGYVWARKRKYCEWVKSSHKQLSIEWLSRFASFVEKADQSRMDSASVATTHRQKLQRTRGK